MYLVDPLLIISWPTNRFLGLPTYSFSTKYIEDGRSRSSVKNKHYLNNIKLKFIKMLKCFVFVLCAVTIVFCAPGFENSQEKQSTRQDVTDQLNGASRTRRQSSGTVGIVYIDAASIDPTKLTNLQSKESPRLAPVNVVTNAGQNYQQLSETNLELVSQNSDYTVYKLNSAGDSFVPLNDLPEDKKAQASDNQYYNYDSEQYGGYSDEQPPPPLPPPPPPPDHHPPPPPPDHHSPPSPPDRYPPLPHPHHPPPTPPPDDYKLNYYDRYYNRPPPPPHSSYDDRSRRFYDDRRTRQSPNDRPPPPPHRRGPPHGRPPPRHGGPPRYDEPPQHHRGPPPDYGRPPPHRSGPPDRYDDRPPPHHGGPPDLYDDRPPPHHGGSPHRFDDRPPPHHRGPPDRYNDRPPPHHRGPPDRYDDRPPPHHRGPPDRYYDRPPPPRDRPPYDRGPPSPPNDRRPPPDREQSYHQSNETNEHSQFDENSTKLIDTTRTSSTTEADTDDHYQLDVRFNDDEQKAAKAMKRDVTVTTARPLSPFMFQAAAVTQEN